MKKVKFAVGDRVAYALMNKYDEYDRSSVVPYFISDYCEDPHYGVVTDLLNDGTVMVQWDSEYMNRQFSGGQDPKTLLLEQDMKKKILVLEKEFKETEKEIKLKMKEAAVLIKNANKLAKKTGNNLAEMYDAVRPLVDSMDSSGWRSSSWGC